MKVAAKKLRIANTPRTSREIYLVTRKGNLRKSARSAVLSQEGEDHLNPPKFLLKNPTDSRHKIVVKDPYGGASLVTPLFIYGVASYFTC